MPASLWPTAKNSGTKVFSVGMKQCSISFLACQGLKPEVPSGGYKKGRASSSESKNKKGAAGSLEHEPSRNYYGIRRKNDNLNRSDKNSKDTQYGLE